MIPPHGLEVTFDKTCHVIFQHGDMDVRENSSDK